MPSLSPVAGWASMPLMRSRNRGSIVVLAVLGLASLALALTIACGGGGGKSSSGVSGTITDPKRVSTATPWASPPSVVFLQDGQLAPIPSNGNTGGSTQAPSAGTPSSTTTSGSCSGTYKVVSGDNPSTIAQKCGVTLDNLLKANPSINPSNLQVGQEIKIP